MGRSQGHVFPVCRHVVVLHPLGHGTKEAHCQWRQLEMALVAGNYEPGIAEAW